MSKTTTYREAVNVMIREPGGPEICRKVRDRLAGRQELDDDEAMRLAVLNDILTARRNDDGT